MFDHFSVFLHDSIFSAFWEAGLMAILQESAPANHSIIGPRQAASALFAHSLTF
jgi:hypothetical protein